MRTIFRRWMAPLCALMVTAGNTQAQEDEIPDFGFIRLVNVVAAGQGNTTYHLDGRNLYPKGYKFAQRTGGVAIKPGSPTLEVKKEGVETGKTKLDVVKSQTTTLIAFSEKLEVEEGEPPAWKAKILKLKQKEVEKGFRLTVVSVCIQEEIPFMIATAARKVVEKPSVKRFRTTSLDLGNSRGDVEIRMSDAKTQLCLFTPDTPGNYVVVFYNDAEGGIKAMSFFDPNFVVAG
ncbi:hypothetical protein ACFQY0_14980 [Haloferula chungangensis]|uniref:DUF4198 domain-containing protein n=1 Tax=Haloferula chungangensis TaxID=1048331 RepID=A0ABW2L806_9BACT